MHRALTFFLLLSAYGAQAQPILTPDAAVMRLDEIGLYEVGYAYRGQPQQQFPIGWSGDFEEHTGVACRPADDQAGQHAFLLHCPWRNGTGIAFQQFSFHLPKVQRILLRGATAMRADIVDKSDGATFRIYAGERKLLDVHRVDARWQPFQFDLTAFAGQTVSIRFETDPGPKDNPSFDFSLWGDRELVLEGYRPNPVVPQDPPPLPFSKVLATQTGSVVPSDGFNGKTRRTLDGEVAVFHYAGGDGELDYRWELPTPTRAPLFGRIVLHARMNGSAPVEVSLAGTATLEWMQPVQPLTSRWEQTTDGIACVRSFKVAEATATVRILGQMLGKSLVLDVACDQPLVRLLDAGGWGPVMRRRTVPVPYYSGQVDYLAKENIFVNGFLDWTISTATSHEHTRAHYDALTDGRRHPLQERVVFTAAWHLAEVLPNIPNPPSPHLTQLADRIVLDVWGGSFRDIAKRFEMLADYGIDHCVALIHDWQRSGYDNALPAHYPANPDLGGDEGMKTLVATGRRLGFIVAVHENYVDYYPNYDHFDDHDIALDSAGKRQSAWYNPGTKIQSFAIKPKAILRLAQTQSPEIHRRYGTNADYLDVHSAVPPWFHVDLAATEAGDGSFQEVWDVHRKLWQYERLVHGGPVFGEGANHWYWSGCLDGVEAQFGAGWPANQGMTAPLMVDFDLLKIHPLQFNHGMGYYERWLAKPAWRAVPPLIVLDQYRMQEIAYGHAGFLGAATWSVLPVAWLEHHLLSPVTARYATARPTQIEYEVGGKWRDGSAAAKADNWQRVRVRYDNGLTVTANGSHDELRTDGGQVLPQFGWMAKGAGVMAYTAVRDGVVVDYAETDASVFANARNANDWNLFDVHRVRPQVAEFAQIAPRTIRCGYRWQAAETLSQNYRCFVHFSVASPTAENEGIRFQQDHDVAVPTSQWKSGQAVGDGPYTLKLPDGVSDGDYNWNIGLWSPRDGSRVTLEGEDDGNRRICLGRLLVREGGNTIRFEPERGSGTESDELYHAHVNMVGKVVDFGSVRTDGSVLIRRDGADWVLWPLARGRNFLVELRTKRFGHPPKVQCVGGATSTISPDTSNDWWRLLLNGAKQYRWDAE